MIPKFLKGLKENLPSSGFTEGTYYQCTDTGELFYASNSTTLKNVSGNIPEILEGLKNRLDDVEDDKQDLLVSGVNIKTINTKSLLGSGNIDVTEYQYEFIDEVTDPANIEFLVGKTSPVYQTVILKNLTDSIKLVPASNVSKGFLNKMLFKNTGSNTYTFDYSLIENLRKEENITILPDEIVEITWLYLEDGSYNIYKSHKFIEDEDPLLDTYLKFTAKSDGNTEIYYRIDSGSPKHRFQYSLNKGVSWTNWYNAETVVTLSKGQSMYVRGQDDYVNSQNNCVRFAVNDVNNHIVDTDGNVMSLLANGTTKTSVPDYCFQNLFAGFPTTVTPKLPALTIGEHSYYRMFRACTFLKTISELPATNVGYFGYRNMFTGCTALVDLSNLVISAETLGTYCYSTMFEKCTGLVKAPQLPATTLSDNCYSSMFTGCTSLTEPPQLPAINLVDCCYAGMFRDCSSLTEAPELHSANLARACYQEMFKGCTNLTQAPELPATILTIGCYLTMFKNCTSLTKAILPAAVLKTDCYSEMFNGCTSLTEIKCLATDMTAYQCILNWVDGVSRTGTFTKASGVEWPSGVSGIPVGWTVIEE